MVIAGFLPSTCPFICLDYENHHFHSKKLKSECTEVGCKLADESFTNGLIVAFEKFRMCARPFPFLYPIISSVCMIHLELEKTFCLGACPGDNLPR